MRATKTKIISFFASCLYVLTAGFPVLADDTDIFVGGAGSTSSKTTNVLFIIDNSGSMADPPACQIGGTIYTKDAVKAHPECEQSSKIDIVKSKLEELLYDPNDLLANGSNATKANPKLKGLNFAIMKFNSNGNSTNTDGGTFVLDFTPLQDDISTSKTKVSKIVGAVKNLQTDNATPLAESMYEATRYYLAQTPLYGINVADGLTKKDPYNPDYSSQCGVENHIVLLTDGMPTNDSDADGNINSLPDGYSSTSTNKLVSTICSSTTGTGGGHDTSDDCLPLVSEYLYKRDFDNDANNGTQNVITHTIAFDLKAQSGTAKRLLDQTATDCKDYDPTQDPFGAINASTAGRKCAAMTADSASELANAFEKILIQINSSTTTFTNAAVAIGSRLFHENQAYFSLFKPDMRPRWEGNLKGYQILDTTDANKVGKDYFDFNDPPNPILDSNGNIKDDTLSKWGSANDGSDINKGGAEAQIPATRVVYTFTGDTSGASIDAPKTLDTLTKTIDRSYFGAADDAERDNLVQWALGEELYDDDNDPNTPMVWRKRHVIGDPLHSQPVIVDYVDGNATTSYAFFGTNDGFLHAVNLTTGAEAFAFIPKELLPNLKTYFENPQMNQLDRPYGLDGEITIGKIKINDIEHVMLYFGMRRGGKNYYAMDVTNVNNPKLAWQITGGVNGTDFAELGQTWSKPLFAKVNFSDPDGKIVLIMGGGYDINEDNPDTTTHSTGRAVYIVDAMNGQRLWWAHGTGAANTRSQSELVMSDMNYSVPSSIAALDVNYDDVVDRLYLVDIAGQVFRIDLDAVISTTDASGTVTTTAVPNGGLIASLRGTNADQQRRFYNEPEVVFTKYGTYQFIRINIGSGYRANPLTTALKNRFYSLRDDNVYDVPASYVPITEANLYDATTNHDADIINGVTQVAGATLHGWYIDLAGSGEKALSQSMTINNHLMFTTYTPAVTNTSGCTPPAGTATFYMVDLIDATPQKTYPLSRGGIPPGPMPLIFPGENSGNPDLEIAVGMEFIKDDKKTDPNGDPLPPLGLEAILNKNYWEEK